MSTEDERRVLLLLVDDEPEIRMLLRSMLGARDWNVDEASSGPEALEKCGEDGYGAIILDQRMPRMTGLEVARELRGRGNETPIVLFSAYLEPDVEAGAQELGLPTVAKEDFEELFDILERLVRA
ncbi:MAG: response regulator [Nitriliruptorales bacterium]|nr:response regulator [Nitriliruptorales bacterium]